MNYTLHQLQIFLKVVQTKRIKKAAGDMTQPAVSIQLRNLQDQFEIYFTEMGWSATLHCGNNGNKSDIEPAIRFGERLEPAD
jgi:hypothetical protein